jgi:hypothetical protein
MKILATVVICHFIISLLIQYLIKMQKIVKLLKLKRRPKKVPQARRVRPEE